MAKAVKLPPGCWIRYRCAGGFVWARFMGTKSHPGAHESIGPRKIPDGDRVYKVVWKGRRWAVRGIIIHDVERESALDNWDKYQWDPVKKEYRQ